MRQPFAVSSDLQRAAREIFGTTLSRLNAHEAVRRAIRLEGNRLTLVTTSFDLTPRHKPIYVVAMGKAARPMAAALYEILDERITAGIVSGPQIQHLLNADFSSSKYTGPERWRFFDGGHPLPNEESFAAARASIELLRRAEAEQALVIFLISGGGSAMIEWPRDEQTTLEELRTLNSTLVTSGASIAEINAVRRAVSAIKGGGLLSSAPHAEQVSLIISDTGKGQEATVASGPTFYPPQDAPDALTVISHYHLSPQLPHSILRAIRRSRPEFAYHSAQALRAHYVLLDNEDATTAAADDARSRGFTVEIARDLVEQPVNEGCSQLLNRLFSLYQRTGAERRPVCLISGGEFSCPVSGPGIGGRNAETVLRCVAGMAESASPSDKQIKPARMVVLSAGTDGVDGNSPAAGALADESTISRAREQGLDPQQSLDASDAFTFFAALGDTIVTGQTGTNVRDLRIMLAG